ncbi:MAG: sugar ABC transporter permease [Anaerolineae bacterium]|nr:sugar ABC transporter permease [Anaerolineae bacterium]
MASTTQLQEGTLARPSPQVRVGFGHRLRNWMTGMGFVAPALALFLIIEVFAIPYNLYISAHLWDGFGEMEYVGTENYTYLFEDPLFWDALEHNGWFIGVSLAITVTLAFFLAVVLDSGIPGGGLFRIMLFLPVITPSIVVGLAWARIYSAQGGLLNRTLELFSLDALTRNWLGDPDLALYSVLAVFVWRWLGYGVILFNAALMDIPQDMRDAPAVDGATAWQSLRYVIIPLLRPVIVIVSIWYILLGFRVFALVYLLTDGGPFGATEVVNTYMYDQVFTFFDLGLGSTISSLLLVALLVVAIMRNRLTAYIKRTS